MDAADGQKSLLPDRPGWILIGFIGLLYCWNLGRVELSVTDEARSAVIVRDMVEDGHWLLPRTPDGYYCEKPLAYYGMAAVLGKLFGINEWTLRGVSVLMGLATLLLTWILARLYATPRAARIAVVALAANILFIGSARDAMVDMTLACFLTAGLTAHFASRLGRLSPMKGAALAGIAFGLAVLTKGPLGLALPIAVAGGDAILEHRGRFWRALTWWKPMLVTGLLALAIPCLWYVPGYLRGGMEFLNTSLLDESLWMPLGKVKRIGVAHHKNLFYYFGVQLVAVLPLLPLLPTLWGWARDAGSGLARRHLLAWLGFGFLLFEIASNKRMYYLIPLQPAVAVMIALAAERALKGSDFRLLEYGAAGVGLLFMLGGVALEVLGFKPSLLSSIREGSVAAAASDQKLGMLCFGMALVFGGIRMLRAAKQGPESILQWSCILALLVIVVRFGLGDRLESEFERTRPFVIEAAGKVPAGKTPVILPPIRGYSIDFYWPSRIVRDKAAAERAEYVLVARSQKDALGPAETLGTWKYGPEGRDDVLLLRREAPR